MRIRDCRVATGVGLIHRRGHHQIVRDVLPVKCRWVGALVNQKSTTYRDRQTDIDTRPVRTVDVGRTFIAGVVSLDT